VAEDRVLWSSDDPPVDHELCDRLREWLDRQPDWYEHVDEGETDATDPA
jgi:hypothetical protein